MPFSPRMARFNRVVLNPIFRRLEPWLPHLGIIYHRGRVTGRGYHNPVQVFPHGDGYLIMLTYGSSADWVKNVLAAGECDLSTRGQRYHLVNPTLHADTDLRDIPAHFRVILTRFNITESLTLTRSTTARSVA